MSTSPYSQDLRKKVMLYLSQGHSQREASRTFNIHKNTINNWNIKYKKEGNYAAKKRLGRPSKVDQNKFLEVVKTNPNTTLKDLGSQFKISDWHASRILKKLGFSYKKKASHTWKQKKTSEMSI